MRIGKCSGNLRLHDTTHSVDNLFALCIVIKRHQLFFKSRDQLEIIALPIALRGFHERIVVCLQGLAGFARAKGAMLARFGNTDRPVEMVGKHQPSECFERFRSAIVEGQNTICGLANIDLTEQGFLISVRRIAFHEAESQAPQMAFLPAPFLGEDD
jgi:hypothetical protein